MISGHSRASRFEGRGVPYVAGGFGLGLSSMISLLVPLRAEQLGASLAMIGLVVAAKPLSEVLVSVRIGSTIDGLGARTSFLMGTGVCAGSTGVMTLVNDVWLLLALMFPLGAGRSLAWISSQTCVSSLRDGAGQATDTARFSFFSNVSQIIGPAVIGVVAVVLGYRQSFLVIALYAAIFFALGRGLPRDAPGDGRGSDGSSLRTWREAFAMLRMPGMRVVLLLTFVRLWTSSVWKPFFPLLLVMSGRSAAFGGTVVSASAVVATAGTLLVGRLSRWGSPTGWCVAGLGLSALGIALSPSSTTTVGAYLVAALIGVGQGFSLPLLIVLVSQAVEPERRGLALASRGAVNAAAGSLAPLVVAPLITAIGMTLGFLVAGTVAGVLLVAAARVRWVAPPPQALGSAGGT